MQLPRDKKFNVLHVVSKLPVGGVENMLLKVIEGYDKKRFNVSICCLKEGGEIADELMRLGYNVEVLNKMKGHGFDIRAVTVLYNLIKRKDVHILRTHQYHANLYGRIAGIIARVPVIIPSFHSLYESPNKPKVHRRLFNHLLASFSDTLVAVSNTVASDIMRHDRVNPKKVHVNYNGVVIDEFNIDISKQEARKALNIPTHPLIVGAVGRLKEEKGHRFLIEAVSGLSDTCVVIVGDGPLLKELEELANQYKVNCIFIGQVNLKRIPLILRALDIFCFPSLWEGLATALIEAMAAGLPVVASDIPSHREVVSDAGILTPPGDAEKLAKTLKMLINNPSLRNTIGKKTKERARIFSIDNTVKAYEDIFEKILKKKKLL